MTNLFSGGIRMLISKNAQTDIILLKIVYVNIIHVIRSIVLYLSRYPFKMCVLGGFINLIFLKDLFN